MSRKGVGRTRSVISRPSVLLIGPSSDSLARKQALLELSGFEIARAENICYAEVFADSRRFDAAVYDDSIPAHEQVALANVMRIRWPWMRLISCGADSAPNLFDALECAESELPIVLRRMLGKPEASDKTGTL
jgi:hypothetical protein